ncbi:MAG: LacI family DNA-binding transcriptional regulator [Phycisphaeraceae bacterium]
MPTIRQVAEVANVSPATASRALGDAHKRLQVSPATVIRVQDAARRLGYRVNYHMRAVSTGRANVTGFAPEVRLDQQVGSGSGNDYFDALRRGVEFTTQEAGMALMSIHPGRGLTALQRGTQYMQERRLDALVVPGSTAVHQSTAMFEDDPSLPLVVVNPLGQINRPRIMFNFPVAMQLIVEHLKSLGHRHVLWFGPNVGISGGPSVRQQMFIDAAWHAGLQGTTHLAAVSNVGPTATTIIDGVRHSLGECLSRSERQWTAIATYNDQWAVGACAALRAAGLDVPGDVSVIGLDNLIATYCIPGLTTVDHGFYEMGRKAGLLAARLAAADRAERVELCDHCEIVEPKLIVRDSTGPAPAVA